MDADNTLETCWEVTTRTLHETFAELYDAAIDLQGILLKPNMVIAGKDYPSTLRPSGSHTRPWITSVPSYPRPCRESCSSRADRSGRMPRITRTSTPSTGLGGPWPLSFSYGRALQGSALEAWGGDPANADAAQAVFAHRAGMNALAVAGEWNAELEQPVAA